MLLVYNTILIREEVEKFTIGTPYVYSQYYWIPMGIRISILTSIVMLLVYNTILIREDVEFHVHRTCTIHHTV
jgi:hypothetical protein